MRLEGGLVDAGGERAAGWSGTVHELLAQSLAPPARTWLRAHELRGSYFWSGGPQRASLEPGSAEALGATLRWSRSPGRPATAAAAARASMRRATIDPLPIAPLLRAIQPDFGWGGDLALKGRLEAHGAPTVRVDAVVERASGDLSVTDEYGTQQLGLTDLRLGVAADDGVWHLTAGAGRREPRRRLGRRHRANLAHRRLARGAARRSKACSRCASPTSAPGAGGCRRAGA